MTEPTGHQHHYTFSPIQPRLGPLIALVHQESKACLNSFSFFFAFFLFGFYSTCMDFLQWFSFQQFENWSLRIKYEIQHSDIFFRGVNAQKRLRNKAYIIVIII